MSTRKTLERISIPVHCHEMPHFLILGDSGSNQNKINMGKWNTPFFDTIYRMMNESPFVGKMDHDEFWETVIYQDTQDMNPLIYNDSFFRSLLGNIQPDIVLSFGTGFHERLKYMGHHMKCYKGFSWVGRYLAEYRQFFIGGKTIHYLELPNPCSNKFLISNWQKNLNMFAYDYFTSPL